MIMDFEQAKEIEKIRHKNKMMELSKEEENLKLKGAIQKEIIRIETAEKRKLEELKFELRRKATKK